MILEEKVAMALCIKMCIVGPSISIHKFGRLFSLPSSQPSKIHEHANADSEDSK